MRPKFRVLANGSNITAIMEKRLLSLSIKDAKGISSDTVDLVLDDRDGKLAIPATGAKLEVWLGYEGGAFLRMGTYVVDEVEISGAPDTMSIRGKAADMGSAIRAPKTRSWDGQTIGQIVSTVAAEHGLQPVVAEALKDQTIARRRGSGPRRG